MHVINEQSSFSVRAKFYADGNVNQEPNTVRWRLKDVTNNRIVRDWTSVDTGASVDITVPASDNAVYGNDTKNRRRFEDRVLVVQADAGTDEQCSDEIAYRIRNLKGFES
jgi:hypothetical protein